jgi:hypothetical protein
LKKLYFLSLIISGSLILIAFQNCAEPLKGGAGTPPLINGSTDPDNSESDNQTAGTNECAEDDIRDICLPPLSFVSVLSGISYMDKGDSIISNLTVNRIGNFQFNWWEFNAQGVEIGPVATNTAQHTFSLPATGSCTEAIRYYKVRAVDLSNSDFVFAEFIIHENAAGFCDSYVDGGNGSGDNTDSLTLVTTGTGSSSTLPEGSSFSQSVVFTASNTPTILWKLDGVPINSNLVAVSISADEYTYTYSIGVAEINDGGIYSVEATLGDLTEVYSYTLNYLPHTQVDKLYNNVHTLPQCTVLTLNGAPGEVYEVSNSISICKLQTSACPTGWTKYENWSATEAVSASGAYVPYIKSIFEGDSNTVLKFCEKTTATTDCGNTASHTWSNVVPEEMECGGGSKEYINTLGQTRVCTVTPEVFKSTIVNIGCY